MMVDDLQVKNLEEMEKSVADLTEVNDARLAYLAKVRAVQPDPSQLLEVKINVLAELIFDGTTAGQRLWFEFTYQKRLSDLLEVVEEMARPKPPIEES